MLLSTREGIQLGIQLVFYWYSTGIQLVFNWHATQERVRKRENTVSHALRTTALYETAKMDGEGRAKCSTMHGRHRSANAPYVTVSTARKSSVGPIPAEN